MNEKSVKDILYKQKQRSYWILLILTVVFIVFVLLNMMMGNTFYSLATIIKSISGEVSHEVLFTIHVLRLPRVLTGSFCGIAFALAGHTFQKMLGNPLASPDIIGVTSGASTVAVFCILMLHMSGSIVSLAAIIGGLLVAIFIYLLSRGNESNARMILIGIGVQAFLNAIISYMLLKASSYDVANALRWLSGSLNGVTMNQAIGLMSVVVVVGLILLMLSHRLSILQLGESLASILGLKVQNTKIYLVICAVILSAVATSVSGPIASVAFLSGPITSRLMNGNQNHMIHSGLVGAILVLMGDLIAQNFLPARYPVGVVTGLFGAPYLIFMLVKLNHKGEMG